MADYLEHELAQIIIFPGRSCHKLCKELTMNTQFAFPRVQSSSLFATFRTKLGELQLEWQQARSRRLEIARVTHELSGYSDRQLADLGFSRADIPEVARGTFSRA